MKTKLCLLTAALLVLSCGTAAVNPLEGTEIWEISSGGENRTVLVHPPASAQESLPVLLVFHGGYGTASGAEQGYGISLLADREGFIAVYPQGIDRHWNDGRIDPDDLSDVVFVQAVLDSLSGRYSVDTGRVYASGMSNGAIFCHFLAVKLPGVLAGIAPVCGGIANPETEWFLPEYPVDVVIIQGTDDPLVPYGGGEIGFRGGRGKVLATSEAVDLWRGINGSSENPSVNRIAEGTPDDFCSASVYLYSGIRDVALVRIDGGGHVWPGGDQYLPERIIGRACTDFQAAEFIWRFFIDAEARKEQLEPERASSGGERAGGRI